MTSHARRGDLSGPGTATHSEARVSEQLLMDVLKRSRLMQPARAFATSWPVSWVIMLRLAHLARVDAEIQDAAVPLLTECTRDAFRELETTLNDDPYVPERDVIRIFLTALLRPAQQRMSASTLRQLINQRDPWLGPHEDQPPSFANEQLASILGRHEKGVLG